MTLSAAAAYGVANWKGEESSGNMLDAINSYMGVESGTGGIGTASGLFSGNARDFELGDGDKATVSDNADISGGDVDLTWIVWLRPETEIGSNRIFFKGADNGQDEYEILKVDYQFRFRVWGGADYANEKIVESPNPPDVLPATNYLLCCKHDSVNNVIGISVNGANWTTAGHTFGIYNSASSLYLGQTWDGLLKEATILRGYCLTNTELTELWNSGSPIPFSDWAPGGGGGQMTGDEGGVLYQHVTNW